MLEEAMFLLTSKFSEIVRERDLEMLYDGSSGLGDRFWSCLFRVHEIM